VPDTELQLGRIGGAEFAVMVTGDDVSALAGELVRLLSAFEVLFQRQMTDALPVVAIGWTPFRPGDHLPDVLTRADAALMQAEHAQPPMRCVDQAAAAGVMSGEAWRRTVDIAFESRAFEMVSYPVARVDGSLLHQEIMVRLVTPEGVHIPAGQFMPVVARQGRQAELDLLVLELAVARLDAAHEDIAVNIAAASVHDAGFAAACAVRLTRAGRKAARLWMEVSESALMDDAGLAGLSALSAVARQHGCKIGIEHFGRYFAAMPKLHDVQVDYVKLDGAFVAGIDSHHGNQRFVKAVVGVARSLNIQVIAERVANEDEWKMLASLDVHGVTGPAVTARKT